MKLCIKRNVGLFLLSSNISSGVFSVSTSTLNFKNTSISPGEVSVPILVTLKIFSFNCFFPFSSNS